MAIINIERVLLDLSYIATIFGAAAIFYQIRKGKNIEKKKFEEEIEKEYRGLVENIPYEVFLGKNIVVTNELRNVIYRYIDYTNSQINLRKNSNISDSTWVDWQEGILSNFKLPVFKNVLETTIENYDIFRELRYLIESKKDPKTWKAKDFLGFINKENKLKNNICSSI